MWMFIRCGLECIIDLPPEFWDSENHFALPTSFPHIAPVLASFLFGRKCCFTSISRNLKVDLRLLVTDKCFNNQPCVVFWLQNYVANSRVVVNHMPVVRLNWAVHKGKAVKEKAMGIFLSPRLCQHFSHLAFKLEGGRCA